MITNLKVRAFKGLREFDISPRRMNLIIGANGTGKTNLADLFSFVASISSRSLVEAMEQQGGLARVRTRQSGLATYYRLKIELSFQDEFRGIQHAHYSFELAQSKEIKIHSEQLEALVYKRRPGKPRRAGIPLFDTASPAELRYKREGNTIVDISDALRPFVGIDDDHQLILSSYGRVGDLRTLTEYLGSWRVYNIDAVMAKQTLGGNETELERYGANIVPFVARLLGDERIRKQLLADLQEVIPYIQDIKSGRVLTYPTVDFSEQDSEFQVTEMSDGTIRLLGLLAVVRQPNPPAVIFIEEPENALHRYAISHFMDVLRRVAMAREFASQIFLTSHSPEVVDEVLNPQTLREASPQIACFVTQRKPKQPAVVQAPAEVMDALAKNLGRPSDFQREGVFEDAPTQLAFSETPQEGR